MIRTQKVFYLTFFIVFFVFNSCRKEEVELIQGPDEQVLIANSILANLMQQTAMNDGSGDNILDHANCFNIKLPITVKVNGIEITVNSEDDLDAVEYVLDTSDDDTDNVELIFPLTIILNDFTEVLINSMTQLNNYSNDCNGENESDLDIECLDFKYPITASLFDTVMELIETVSIDNDYELYRFLDHIDQNDVVTLEFPIIMVLSDGTEIMILDLIELKNAIETYSDDCDEDDDYDYNDDDCDKCSQDELMTLLTNCSNWMVDKLERNDNDYDDLYDGYEFNFHGDGTISVYWNGYEAYGTWSASGSANNIAVAINIPDLPYCNNNWTLHEIQSNSGESRVDFRVGGADRLRYVNNCN